MDIRLVLLSGYTAALAVCTLGMYTLTDFSWELLSVQAPKWVNRWIMPRRLLLALQVSILVGLIAAFFNAEVFGLTSVLVALGSISMSSLVHVACWVIWDWKAPTSASWTTRSLINGAVWVSSPLCSVPALGMIFSLRAIT